MREGDLVHMRARYADGTTPDWVTVRARGIEAKDARNAEVAPFCIGLVDAGNGKVRVENINASRQVSEPGAQRRRTNVRTGEETKVTIIAEGGFPADFQVHGRAGDWFSVSAQDGVDNTAFSLPVGNATDPGGTPGTQVLVPDPALHTDALNADGTPKFGKTPFTGPLFIDVAGPGDVQRGQIANCSFPSSSAAIALTNPDAPTDMIKDHGDGAYTVTLKERDRAGQGRAHQGRRRSLRPLVRWPAVRALVQQRRPEDEGAVVPAHREGVRAVEGRERRHRQRGPHEQGLRGLPGRGDERDDAVLRGPGRGVAAHHRDRRRTQAARRRHPRRRPACRYTNSGVYADHACSIVGYEQGAGGARLVVRRNPWGEPEPAGNGPNDRVFQLKPEDFSRLYQSLCYSL